MRGAERPQKRFSQDIAVDESKRQQILSWSFRVTCVTCLQLRLAYTDASAKAGRYWTHHQGVPHTLMVALH